MKKTDLKKLSELTISETGEIDENSGNYILAKLTKKELKLYLNYLKKELEGRRASVRMPELPDKSTENAVSAVFRNRKVYFSEDKTMGAGMQIQLDDNLININVKNLIERAIDKMKSI